MPPTLFFFSGVGSSDCSVSSGVASFPAQFVISVLQRAQFVLTLPAVHFSVQEQATGVFWLSSSSSAIRSASSTGFKKYV